MNTSALCLGTTDVSLKSGYLQSLKRSERVSVVPYLPESEEILLTPLQNTKQENIYFPNDEQYGNLQMLSFQQS